MENNQLAQDIDAENITIAQETLLKEDFNKVTLNSPTLMPNAGGFLWNKNMMIQMNCRGYANAQFMQPESAKYSVGPAMDAKNFMQPEHQYYAHHPGRFFYVKDEANNELFSLPFEPCRKPLDKFNFTLSDNDISWQIEQDGLLFDIKLTLPKQGCYEIWTITVNNLSGRIRNISMYPAFSVGYKSWMNQSSYYNDKLNAVIADAITPYQKVEDYFVQKDFKDKTFLLAQTAPDSWTAELNSFEGIGGISFPDQVKTNELARTEAKYEVPVAVMQYRLKLAPGVTNQKSFVFGAAQDEQEIEQIRQQVFADNSNLSVLGDEYKEYHAQAKGVLSISYTDTEFCQFINHWLPRQIFYHGDVHRLTTDPQTRNLLQDSMGMSYINPEQARTSFLYAIAQQQSNGLMPDGILMHENAELKYINQVPHADHSVWLTICIKAYLDETNDKHFLNEMLPFSDNQTKQSVQKHLELAIDGLLAARDERGLSYIEQGDWCDPMNMVGYQGKGVSSWLTMATAWALECWLEILNSYSDSYDQDKLKHYQNLKIQLNNAINQYFWDGNWYARGITDNGVTFGISEDNEGKIYLNPQSWSLLCGAASMAKQYSMLNAVDKHLMTPFGVMMLAPAYTKMREDIGRISQKYPGVAENGSVYNHAAAFYAYALYQVGEYDQAYQVLRKMLPDETDAIQRGQLNVYIPNYYRGAYYQHTEHAGRSSHLFNTGTVSWVYRCLIEELAGLKGCKGDLIINPKLPADINEIKGRRLYLGKNINFSIVKAKIDQIKVWQNGILLEGNIIKTCNLTDNDKLTIQVPCNG